MKANYFIPLLVNFFLLSSCVKCAVSLTTDFPCTEVGYFEDPMDCQKYHICHQNAAGDLVDEEAMCAAPTIWCQELVTCEKPSALCPCFITVPTTSEMISTTTQSGGNERPKNCLEIQQNGLQKDDSTAMTYTIYPFGPDQSGVEVLCDFETQGGGWTILLWRGEGGGEKFEFYRNWTDYEDGFGSPAATLLGNYWIGLKAIHALTSLESNGQQELRVDISGFEGDSAYAIYNQFSIGNESDFYRLSVSEYSGDAGDAFGRIGLGGGFHVGMQFTTADRDNDHWDEGNCAQNHDGAWWFNKCFASHLTGPYFEEGETIEANTGIQWMTWKGKYYAMATASMKIRDMFTYT